MNGNLMFDINIMISSLHLSRDSVPLIKNLIK